MKRLTNFGKRVMATLALIVVCILVGLGGFVAVWDKACKIGIDQQAYNVLFFCDGAAYQLLLHNCFD